MSGLRKKGTNATSKAILHSWLCLAHNAPLPQKGIFAKVRKRHERDRKWSQAVAVGSEDYIENIKKELGMKVIYRKTNQVYKGFELREDQFPYNADFASQNARLSHNNSHLWNIYQ